MSLLPLWPHLFCSWMNLWISINRKLSQEQAEWWWACPSRLVVAVAAWCEDYKAMGSLFVFSLVFVDVTKLVPVATRQQ